MSQELDAPLGRKRRPNPLATPLTGRGFPWARIGFFVLALIGAGAIGWIVAIEDPMGGLPQAEATIGTATPNPLVEQIAAPPASAPEPAPPAVQGTPIDGPSIITLGADYQSAGIADEAPLTQTERDILAFGARPELIEVTQYGMIPRVSASGERPFSAYARPSITPATANGRGLVSVIVTGLGLNQTTTLDAIEALPGAVTLAFAPYGGNLDATTARAREDGHELMLEIPLEPFDYPQSDPGPHTLLVEQPPRANLEKLYWLLARFGGYTGVVNHMGARFTASAADFGPVVEELGLRGIGYLDDGSSARSVAPQLTRANQVPFLRSSRVLDANPSRAAILAELDALEARAARDGSAIATLSALPISIATLAEWAQGLDEDRTVLVPFSALAANPSQP